MNNNYKDTPMKKTTLTLLSIATIALLTGCGDKPKSDIVTYKYTPAEVYTATCAHCHGDKGEGMPSKKGPAIDKKTIPELEMDLFDIKNGGVGQSTATEHDVMEHNMKKLKEKGYEYDVKAMANYIYNTFNKGK
jgi:cytochrome c553